MRHWMMILVLVAMGVTIGGCGMQVPKRTGFLSSYDGLTRNNSMSKGFNAGPERLGRYDRFIVEPVELRLADTKGLPEGEGERLAEYLRDQVVQELSEDFTIVSHEGEGIARVRMALTQITRSTLILNLHPGMKMLGAGLGGAAIEAEIVDSRTGERLWVLVEARKGNQMELDAFKPYDDAEDAAEMWAALMRRAIDQARDQMQSGQ